MTETLTGKQVLALLAQDEVPEIEAKMEREGMWFTLRWAAWHVGDLLNTDAQFRIKPKPARRLSVTLANGEVISWPEPVRDELETRQEYWFIGNDGDVDRGMWTGHPVDKRRLAFGNVHLTKEAAQEHADALRKINTQGVV